MSLEQERPSLSIEDPKGDAILSIDISNPNKLKSPFWEDFLQWQTDRIDEGNHLSLTIAYFDKQPETITLDVLRKLKNSLKADYNALLRHLIDDRILKASKVSLTGENKEEYVLANR